MTGRRNLTQPGADTGGAKPTGGSQAGCAEGLGQGREEARGSQEDSCPEGLRTQPIAAEVVGIGRIDWYKLGSSRGRNGRGSTTPGAPRRPALDRKSTRLNSSH